jgi:hypothetical protein
MVQNKCHVKLIQGINHIQTFIKIAVIHHLYSGFFKEYSNAV